MTAYINWLHTWLTEFLECNWPWDYNAGSQRLQIHCLITKLTRVHVAKVLCSQIKIDENWYCWHYTTWDNYKYFHVSCAIVSCVKLAILYIDYCLECGWKRNDFTNGIELRLNIFYWKSPWLTTSSNHFKEQVVMHNEDNGSLVSNYFRCRSGQSFKSLVLPN